MIFPKIQDHDKCLLHIQDDTGKKPGSRQEWKCNGQPGKKFGFLIVFDSMLLKGLDIIIKVASNQIYPRRM